MFKLTEQIIDIVLKKKQGTILSAGEEAYYQQWMEQQAPVSEPFEPLDSVKAYLQYEEEERATAAAFDDKFARVLQEEKQAEAERMNAARKGRVINLVKMAVAVAVVAIVATTAWFSWSQKVVQVSATGSKPFATQLNLTLGNGEDIVISQPLQDLGMQGAYHVVYNKGVLSYILVNPKEYAVQAVNTIQVPAGRTLQVQLPDGSKAWLNAASSLTFPVHQTQRERAIALTGEGYFEVKKDSGRRFIVHSGGIQVEAVGTRFTVAQVDSLPSRITLQEGIINIRSKKVFTQVKQPQVWLASESRFEIMSMDADTTKHLIEEATARQRGIFYFYAATLAEIVPVLERWYNLKLDNKEILLLPDRFHIDAVPVTAPFEQFKMALEGSKVVKVSVDGRTLHIEKRR